MWRGNAGCAARTLWLLARASSDRAVRTFADMVLSGGDTLINRYDINIILYIYIHIYIYVKLVVHRYDHDT